MINNFINISNELIVYYTGTFVHFFSFHFFSFWGFSVYRMQICFGFKNIFFLSTNFMPAKSWISAGIYRNTRNKPKWPEIFSKWNRNTQDKILGVATANVGWENWWGSLALLILLTKDDLEICYRALLIASVPMPWWEDLFWRLLLLFSNLSWHEEVE